MVAPSVTLSLSKREPVTLRQAFGDGSVERSGTFLPTGATRTRACGCKPAGKLSVNASRTSFQRMRALKQSVAMVSVIIPTYNRALFLKEALDSVLLQKNVELEVIVVDDGSTDKTSAIVESCGRPVTYLYQSNAGVSAARNAGIKMAHGEWLAFLDSDDLWLPGKLEFQLDFLRRQPAAKICQTEELWIRNGRRQNPKKYHKKPSGYCFPALLERCLVSPSAVMIHRELFDEVGLFDETLPACEDYDLWLRIGSRHSIGLVERLLIVKRGGHPDQLSTSIAALDQYRIRSLIKLLRSDTLSTDQRAQALAVLTNKCRVYGEGCLKRGRIEEARWALAQTHRL